MDAAVGTPPGSFEVAPSDEVHVHYLAVEACRGGFRWTVRRFGSVSAVRTCTETFASEVDAPKAGRSALIATCAAGRRVRHRASAS